MPDKKSGSGSKSRPVEATINAAKTSNMRTWGGSREGQKGKGSTKNKHSEASTEGQEGKHATENKTAD
jgi:hypothetical protein